jgi:hypothetical protein
MMRVAGVVVVAGLLLGAGLPPGNVVADDPPGRDVSRPLLLTWDVLTTTVYDPRRPLLYPPAVEAANGVTVRMEGFLMPRYDSQDPGDLFLTALHPRNFFCGPSDITQMVELFIPSLDTRDLPLLPVEVVGTFHLSRRPGNFRPIYMFLASSWKPLHTWVQDFPGVVDEERRSETDSEFGGG